MNAAPLVSNYTLIVETGLPCPLNFNMDYSENKVVQKRTRGLKDTVTRMTLQNVSPCRVAIFWTHVARAHVGGGTASS